VLSSGGCGTCVEPYGTGAALVLWAGRSLLLFLLVVVVVWAFLFGSEE
jgi:hypothetical protein